MFLSNIWQQLISKKRPREISVFVWDFDGTLYRHEKLADDLKSAYFGLCFNKNNHNLRLSDFDNLAKKYGRWSKATSVLTGVNEIEVISYVENKIDKASYLNPKNRLVNMVEYLKGYKHLILSNSSGVQIKSCLLKLGYRKKPGFEIFPFEKIFGRDTTGVLKPDEKAFKILLEYTKLKPDLHLVIGDSFSEDINPARRLGFQAIHVTEVASFLPQFR